MIQLAALPGRVLDGKYEIKALLGKGGMGAVYRARHLGTSRTVALKVIVPHIAAGPVFLERFRREAEAAGSLRHPNVVDVTDFGVAAVDGDRIAYLVMEYLDGCDLSDVLEEEHHLPVDWAVDVVEQVAMAISEAHRGGIVHRDLKPQNIWLEPNRRGGFTIKVLDFGVAKLAGPHDEEPLPALSDGSIVDAVPTPATEVSGALPSAPLDELPTLPLDDAPATLASGSSGAPDTAVERSSAGDELTQAGAIVGTPHYMSPEQCSGNAVDARADIYSLGVIAYEMLAGERPFHGSTSELLRQHISVEPRDLGALRPEIPAAAAKVVMSALAKDPDDRPVSAKVFASSLRANAERTRALLLRALALAVEHAGTFLKLFAIAYLPLYAARILYYAVSAFSAAPWARALLLPIGLVSLFAAFASAALGRGLSAVLISQLTVAPMRKVRLRVALGLVRRRLRVFVLASIAFLAFTILPVGLFLGLLLGALRAVADGMPAAAVGLFIAAAGAGALAIHWMVRTALLPVVVLVENLGALESFRRGIELSRRVTRTLAGVSVLLMLLFGISNGVSAALRYAPAYLSDRAIAHWPALEFGSNLVAVLMDAAIAPLFAIVHAVLYIQARQAGGETLDEIVDQPFVEQELPRTRWQLRMQSSEIRRQTEVVRRQTSNASKPADH